MCIRDSSSGLFLVSLDEEGVWYRYHALFQALLRRRLEQLLGPEAIAVSHGRAGTWLAAHGFTEEALRPLLAAGGGGAGGTPAPLPTLSRRRPVPCNISWGQRA